MDSSQPSDWPNASLPQGNPPNGKLERAHSHSDHTAAIHTGAPGSGDTRRARTPNRPTYTAHAVASASHGTGPT